MPPGIPEQQPPQQRSGGILGMISPAIGGVLGAIMGIGQDKRQLRQQQALQDMQIRGNMQMADYNYAKQLQMWKDTGYEAQKQQMKDAGLNPSLLYGMGGGGGQSTGSPSGGVAGGQAAATTGTAERMAAMGINLASQQANIDLMKSQAELNRVTAQKRAGVETEEAQARIGNLVQGVEESKTKQFLMESQRYLQTLEYNFKLAVASERVDKFIAEMESAVAKKQIDVATKDEKIKLFELGVIEAGLKNLNIEADTAKKLAEIAQGWKGLTIQEQRLQFDKALAELGLENKDEDQIIEVLEIGAGLFGKGMVNKHKKVF